MTKENNEEKSLEVKKEEEIRLAKMLSGDMAGTKVPFIPIIKVNNKKEEKVVKVDGVDTKVEIPAKKGFNLTTKGEDGYDTIYWKEELTGGFLKQRYMIQSNYGLEPSFVSREFDDFNETIELFERQNRDNVVATGTYAELKDMYKTGEMNSFGKPKTSMTLFLIVYIDVDDEIFRIQISTKSRNNWFDYKNSFKENEVISGVETKFNLKEDTKGENKYWYLDVTRGEGLDLTKQLKKQIELTKFFKEIKDAFANKTKQAAEDMSLFNSIDAPNREQLESGELLTKEGESEQEDDIDVKSIPF